MHIHDRMLFFYFKPRQKLETPFEVSTPKLATVAEIMLREFIATAVLL